MRVSSSLFLLVLQIIGSAVLMKSHAIRRAMAHVYQRFYNATDLNTVPMGQTKQIAQMIAKTMNSVVPYSASVFRKRGNAMEKLIALVSDTGHTHFDRALLITKIIKLCQFLLSQKEKMNVHAIVHWTHSNVIPAVAYQIIIYAMAIHIVPISPMNGIVLISAIPKLSY